MNDHFQRFIRLLNEESADCVACYFKFSTNF